VPDIMVKIKGLDRFLPSIRRRVKHVGCFALRWLDSSPLIQKKMKF